MINEKKIILLFIFRLLKWKFDIIRIFSIILIYSNEIWISQ